MENGRQRRLCHIWPWTRATCRSRLGYVGEPLSIAEVKIAEDGEILLRGAGVFKGYFKDPELTAITLEGGWLHTGDVGAMDSGFLRILVLLARPEGLLGKEFKERV